MLPYCHVSAQVEVSLRVSQVAMAVLEKFDGTVDAIQNLFQSERSRANSASIGLPAIWAASPVLRRSKGARLVGANSAHGRGCDDDKASC